jgi:hypothetical protein
MTWGRHRSVDKLHGADGSVRVFPALDLTSIHEAQAPHTRRRWSDVAGGMWPRAHACVRAWPCASIQGVTRHVVCLWKNGWDETSCVHGRNWTDRAESDVLTRGSMRILHNPARGSMCTRVYLENVISNATLSTSPCIELWTSVVRRAHSYFTTYLSTFRKFNSAHDSIVEK